MYTYSFSKEEQDYLKAYDGSKYERPSVAADMAIFSIMEEGERENFKITTPLDITLARAIITAESEM